MGKSSLSLVHNVKIFLKEAVEAPPEELKEEVFEDESVEKEFVEELPSVAEVEAHCEDFERSKPVDEHKELLEELNSATSRWKETGDLQVQLEPAIPLRTRMKEVLDKWKEKGAPHVHHLHETAQTLFGKLKSRKVKVAIPVAPTPENKVKVKENTGVEQEIMNDWIVVLGRTIPVGEERQEIEQLYKQLTN